jgi:hypothetical protein
MQPPHGVNSGFGACPHVRLPLQLRLMLDGVLWLLRSGATWRDMPDCLGLGARFITASGFGETEEYLIRCSTDYISSLTIKDSPT